MWRVRLAIVISCAALALTIMANLGLLFQFQKLDSERTARAKSVERALVTLAKPLANLLSVSFQLDDQHMAKLSKKEKSDFKRIRSKIIAGKFLTPVDHKRLIQILGVAGYKGTNTIKTVNQEIRSIHQLVIISRGHILIKK